MDKPQSPAQDDDVQRLRTLLEINNAVISSLTQEALFHAIAGALRRIVPFDRTAIFLHDADKDVLRLFILESSLATSYFTVGMEMPQEESHVGWAFAQQRYRVCRDLSSERDIRWKSEPYQDGVRSYVIVPLVARGRTIGVLAVASTIPGQYSDADAVFLQEAANQIGLAVENMKAYEAITTLNREVRAEAARRREVEETLRAVVEGTASMTGERFLLLAGPAPRLGAARSLRLRRRVYRGDGRPGPHARVLEGHRLRREFRVRRRRHALYESPRGRGRSLREGRATALPGRS